MRVGFVGVGAIGGPMVDRLLANGVAVNVYARKPEVVERYRSLGATIATDLEAVARGAQVVALCPFTDEQVLDIALSDGGVVGGLERDAVLITHTTGSPATVRALARVAEPRGASVIDAPVSGTVDDVREGHITLLVGGAESAVDACMPALETYAEPVLHVGPLGSGQAVKLINNVMLAANVRMLQQAERVAATFGIEPATLDRALQHASGGTWVAGAAEAAGSADEVARRFGPFLRKDVATVLRVAAELELDLGLLEQVATSGGPF
jgi:3-hydroxyisobutyrate dehydrogenase-like beta-hydroxyacid dehydrogenase